MATTVLRIFSYLPNPRVWKALIAAELLGVHVEVVGDKPKNLGNWLWDFSARPLNEEEKVPAMSKPKNFDAISEDLCIQPVFELEYQQQRDRSGSSSTLHNGQEICSQDD